jgi:hypothetical protein
MATTTSTVLARFGEVTETNDRIATIEVRPGFREGDRAGLVLRCWGRGHWCRQDGQPLLCNDRVSAAAEATRWIETGRAA